MQRLKTNTVNGYLSEMSAAKGTGAKGAVVATAKKVLAKLKSIEKVVMEFIESGAYSSLPTEADEQIEETRETVEENERLLEEISAAVEENNEFVSEMEADTDEHIGQGAVIDGENEEPDKTDEEASKTTDITTEESVPKPRKDIFTELEIVLKKLIPEHIDNDREDRHNKRTKDREIGGRINIIL